MKVVKISSYFPPRRGGIGDYTRILCEGLVNSKKDIFLYIITSLDPAIIESSYSYERIKVLPAINDWSFACAPIIKNIIMEISPDIVHIEYNRTLYGSRVAMNFLAYLLKRGNPKYKIIVTIHDLPNPLKSRDLFFWLTTFVMLIYCDKVILTNDLDINRFICKLPFVKRKCILVPVGSNIPKVDSHRDAARKQLNISENAVVICFFGFMRYGKFLDGLMYVFSNLAKMENNVKFLIVGGILTQDIFLYSRKLCRALNIEDKIIWMDYQSAERVSELLSASDIAVLPYKMGIGTNSGAFAACVLHKLPIVTTMARFMPIVLKDNYNLRLVRNNTVKELTDALFGLIQDSSLRKKLSENLKELNDYLSWHRISQEILKLYTQF
ncbi:MAG: glycosyltransferase [Candidatus Omnitrophota bacterium]